MLQAKRDCTISPKRGIASAGTVPVQAIPLFSKFTR